MAKAKELNESATKVVQWLNEAHAKEAELEADLTAHISLTEKASYKKRLKDHLKQTKEHKRAVARRIKQIGGDPTTGPLPGVAGEAAGKAVAAVKGQIGAVRALVTEQAETHLRQAQEELREEQVEIALYSRIETLAEQVGDRDTAQLAKRIRREEERMAKFLTAELTRLVKDVVRADIPRDQRAAATRRRTSTRPAAATRSAATRRRTTTRAASSRPAAKSSRAAARGTRATSRSGAS
jgi:ferritin-like metal-binding protein YciE